MRSWPSSFINELRAEVSRVFVLARFSFTSVYRVTDADRPLYYNGEEYTPLAMSVSDVTYTQESLLESVTLELDNASLEQVPRFNSEDVNGTQVIIYMQALNSSGSAIATVTLFVGYIDGWSLDETRVSVRLRSEASRFDQMTLPRYTPSCRWVFKSSRCGYSGGASWCDHSYTRCKALNNEINFMGFPELTDLETVDIWWGRQRGE